MIDSGPQFPRVSPASIIELGKAFATNTINTAIYRHHGIVTKYGAQYTAFYKDEKTVQIVKRDLAGGRTEQFNLENTHSITDAHNTISLGIDRGGYLHLAICTHAGHLGYRISMEPGRIDAWSDQTHMTGVKEDRVTYPTFIMPQGHEERPLLFLYRNGTSQRGEACMKRYAETERKWSDLDHCILSGMDNQPWSSGPYWNHPVLGENGILYLSFVWRTAPVGAEQLLNNKGIDYARSKDGGKSWFSTNGTLFHLPITQANCETIFPLPPAANLINQASMAVDSKGNPHIVFYADDLGGIPQYQHLWFDGARWRCNLISERVNDFALAITAMGGATMPLPISRPEIVIDKSEIAYVIFRADFVGDKLAALRLLPPNYEYKKDDVRILWDEPVGFAEPVIDRMRWNHEQILSILVQNNYQPKDEGYSGPIFEPIRIVDWNNLFIE